MSKAEHPSQQERNQYRISSYRGIKVGLGVADPLATAATKLAQQYPNHLVLMQAGKFLHGFDRTAHVLATLKGYHLKLIGSTDEPHLRIGFPAANFKRRLWSMGEEFGIPYVVALGTQKEGYTVFISEAVAPSDVMRAATNEIVHQVIEDLRQRGNLNRAAAKKVLADPDTADFKLKMQAQVLDTHLLQDIIKMPRDLRTTYGENVRTCMARLMPRIYGYGLGTDKPSELRAISADIDLLKHYLGQAPRLSRLKFAFEHRVGLAVELGRLTGGLIRSQKVAP